MKRFFTLSLSSLIGITMLISSCSTPNATSQTTTPTTVNKTTTITATSAVIPTTISTTRSTAVNNGNWWDSLGMPQYGGQMVIRIASNPASFDPYFSGFSIRSAWMEQLVANDWTTDPAIFNYQTTYRPEEYQKGGLTQSWEFLDSSTYVAHLRQGVLWQNISPANGREFIASDVVFHFNRQYGTGDGYTKTAPSATDTSIYQNLTSVTATDKYTLVFKWKVPNPEYILEALHGIDTPNHTLESPDEVKFWGDANDWHHAIGTGPFILQDFVSGSSATLIRNPNYWGYDERYPQNKLPYVDTVKFLVIPDTATGLAGMRTNKIDAMDGITLQQSQQTQKTNPEIVQVSVLLGAGTTLDPRNDVKPFNDIRVRKAMQLALDLPTIAKTYYAGTVEPYPLSLTSSSMTGWGFPYSQWPQDLKDEYSYNPTGAKKLLADAGYPNGFKTDVVADVAGDLDLLQVVKAYFADVGINMEIRPMDSVAFTSFVRRNHSQDALAFKLMGFLGAKYAPLTQMSTGFITGLPNNFINVSDPEYDAFNAKSLNASTIDQVKVLLRDLNELTARKHYTISLLQPMVYYIVQPWLKGFNGQAGGILGMGGAGSPQLYFWAPRYWIDSKLKKSLGG